MKSQHVFVALIGAQSLHSLEEYILKLWETFPPAQFLTGLVSADPARGFIVINLSLIALGIWCYWWPVRRRWTSATSIASWRVSLHNTHKRSPTSTPSARLRATTGASFSGVSAPRSQHEPCETTSCSAWSECPAI